MTLIHGVVGRGPLFNPVMLTIVVVDGDGADEVVFGLDAAAAAPALSGVPLVIRLLSARAGMLVRLVRGPRVRVGQRGPPDVPGTHGENTF